MRRPWLITGLAGATVALASAANAATPVVIGADGILCNLTKTLAADVTDVVQQVKKTWLNHGNMKSDETRHLVKFVSSDDRIAEAIEEVCADRPTWEREYGLEPGRAGHRVSGRVRRAPAVHHAEFRAGY